MNNGVKLIAGPALCGGAMYTATALGVESMQAATLGAAAWMLTWWIADAVPLAVTSLLPIVLFPALGIMTVQEATASYGSHYIFLFFGGFLIALALEKWHLHQRIALWVLARAGHSRRRLVGAFMLATALLSMWISNTATTLMMLPIAMSVISQVPAATDGPDRFPVALLLGTAYAANIGGLTTLVGTPPNVAMAGILSEQTGIEVPFFGWMMMALPFGAILLWAIYFLMTRWLVPTADGAIGSSAAWFKDQLRQRGPWGAAEKRLAVVFAGTALFWVFRSPLNEAFGWGLTDTGIAMTGGLCLFLLPAGSRKGEAVLQWTDAKRLPWEILLLFGGGLTLAKSLADAGWIAYLAEGMTGAHHWPWWAVAAALTAMGLLMTEVMSNLALTVVFVPVVIQLAQALGLHPLLFAVPLTLASSCAFMLPMATPPNAIVFGSGRMTIREMAGVGIWLNGVAIAFTALLSWAVLQHWVALIT